MLGFGVEVGSAHDEAPLRPRGARCPDLLSVQHPLVTIEFGAGLHVGEVAPGVGLAVTLAPDVVSRKDTGKEALLLLIGSKVNHGRAEQAFADVPHPAGALRAGVLLVEDHLLIEREIAATDFTGPTDTNPAVGPQLLFPGVAFFEQRMFVTGPTTALDDGKFAFEIFIQPARDLAAKGFVFFAEAGVHGFVFLLRMAPRRRRISR